jgi:integrase
LSRNPARDVKPRREPAGRVRFLDDSERARLLDACAKSDDWRLLPIALLGVYTGARASEVMGLRWRDVVMDRRVVFVHGTKNATSRALPLAPPVLEALRELNRTRRRVGVELIFADAEGRAKFPRKAWERAVRDAGLVDFSFHDTRHTAASYFCMAGASLRELAELLGHKSLAMTQRYSHLATDHLVSVADRMAAAFPADRGAK